jgi:MFS transporter, DHA1 family, inner membrane transport protein
VAKQADARRTKFDNKSKIGETLMDTQKDDRHKIAIVMFGILLGSYMCNAMDRQIFPLLLSDVRKEYGYTIYDAGLLSTIFTLGLAVAGIPTGYLLTKMSRKAVLQLGILIFSVGTAATVLAYGFTDMLIYRAVTGIGEAMQVTVLIAICANYFSNYRSAAVGTLSFTYGIGAIIGPVLAGFLLSYYQSWRFPMVIFGLLGIVAMGFIALFVKPWFSETLGTEEHQSDTSGESRLFNHNIVVLTVVSVLWGLTLYAYFGLYPTYLREALKYTPPSAGSMMSFFGIGALTSIGGGWLGDRFSPRLVLSGAFFAAAGLGWLLFHSGSSFPVLAAITLVWGMVAGGILFVNVAAYHVKAVRPALSSRGAGLFVTTFYAAGAASGYILGFLVNAYSWQTAADIQIVGLSLIAGLVSLTIKPERMLLRQASGKPQPVTAPAAATLQQT